MFQLTLCILKPDIVRSPRLFNEIIELILKRQFIFVKSKRLQLTRERAGEFYREHQEKFFYSRLVHYMTCGPISCHILGRDNAIQEWRSMLGPTKVFKTVFEAENTIRGQHGVTDTRNCGHGSDSTETAQREINFFFPEFDMKSLSKYENIPTNNLIFNRDIFEHQLTQS
ncbi:hypothetical protein I4U23_026949 [Adineta vaga]|nr:hypothetical protein I4U23_026949 [Adineta vaga]